MDYEEALGIWQIIRGSSLVDERQEFVDLAVRYARMRVDYFLAEPEKQRWLGADRAACHNALICACDILARRMDEVHEKAGWRKELGDDRKEIGDFACHLHAMLGIAAR
jgi:hypothetical protein